MMRCVGIDLAWSPHNLSAGFILEVKGDTARNADWRQALGSNAEILDFIQAAGAGPALVAIDAPLVVPNSCGARGCDREVARCFGRFQAGPHPANRRILARYGGLRAEALRGRIEGELGFEQDPHIHRRADVRQVMEVYPHPSMVALFQLDKTLKYKRGPVTQRRAELARLQQHIVDRAHADPVLQPGLGWRRDILSLRGRRLKQYEDLLDSLFCAYVAAYCWYHGPSHYQVFGNRREGHILVAVPPNQRDRLGLLPEVV